MHFHNHGNPKQVTLADLRAAEDAYRARSIADRALADPVITAFGQAVRHAGYTPLLTPVSGTLVLRECPHCPAGKANFSTCYRDDSGNRVWACPHCRRITST